MHYINPRFTYVLYLHLQFHKNHFELYFFFLCLAAYYKRDEKQMQMQIKTLSNSAKYKTVCETETAARPEHSGTNRSAGTAAVSHLLHHCWKSYTGYRFANAWLQAGRIDVQDPEHINSRISQPSHQTSGIHTSPPFFNHTTTPQTDYQNSLRRPRVPLLRSCCLELSEH